MRLETEIARRAFQEDLMNGKPLVFHSEDTNLGPSDMEGMYYGVRDFLADILRSRKSPDFRLDFCENGGYGVSLAPGSDPPVKFSTTEQH